MPRSQQNIDDQIELPLVELLSNSYMKHLHEVSRHLHAQLVAMVEAEHLALLESIRKTLEPIVADFSQAYAAQLAEVGKVAMEFLTPVFEKLQQFSGELSPRLREAILTLGFHGWYLDLDMAVSDLWDLGQALREGNVTDAETWLHKYFDEALDEIEASITSRFPCRAHIIGPAFEAHKRGEYVLSIPLFLAQADGICREMTNEQLFKKRNKKPQVAAFVERVAGDSVSRAALLSPLTQTLPINASEQDRPAEPNALNRHEVLHGTSLDYGTKTNSLKAVSLLNYVATVVDRYSEKTMR